MPGAVGPTDTPPILISGSVGRVAKKICDSCDSWVCDFTKMVSALVAIASMLIMLGLEGGAPSFVKIPASEAARISGFIGMLAVVILLLISIKPRLRQWFPSL